MLILLQTLIFFIGLLITGFLLAEGWFTQAVWSKDCRQGLLGNITQFDAWLFKTHKDKDPDWYWGFMGFYGALFLIFLLLLIL